MRSAHTSRIPSAGKLFFSLMAAATVAACGGGDGGAANSAVNKSTASIPASPDTPTDNGPSAEGIWQGSMSLGWDTTAFVLSTGQTYFIYSLNGVVQDMVAGYGTSRVGSFSSTDALDFSPLPLRRTSTIISGTYSAGQSFNGTVTKTAGEFSHTDTFATTYQPLYASTPSLSALSGTYKGSAALRSGTGAVTASLDANGVISGTLTLPSGACSVSGSVGVAGNGKAILNAKVSLAGASCPLNGGYTEGAAAVLSTASGSSLYLAALLQDKSDGVVALATRQ